MEHFFHILEQRHWGWSVYFIIQFEQNLHFVIAGPLHVIHVKS